jgi:cation diffusion facilitator CzcD-associated flavoprotein CzcO
MLDAYQLASGNHVSRPIPLDRFIDYGRWFQRQAVPEVDERKVTSIAPDPIGFRLTLADGETLQARRVVVATGIRPFAWRPPQFKHLSPLLASHASDHRELGWLAGQRVVVIGAGQSALESAALLREARADVEVLARAPVVYWLWRRPWVHTCKPVSRLLYAPAEVGPAFVSHLVSAPNWFRQLPRRLQDRLGRRALRPAGARWLRPRLTGVPITTGKTVTSAVPVGRQLRLTLDDGSERQVHHVLLATGYRVNIALYSFLAQELLASLHCVDGYPVLDVGFETSVPGLHFLGASAAWSFGPLMRFVAGTEFAARALTHRIRSNSVPKGASVCLAQ